MPYPDYPNNRLIVDGIDLTTRFRIALLDGYVLSPPEPKTYMVDIPGGNGSIDLTEAMTKDVVYSNRKQEFTFAAIDTENFEEIKTEVSNFLHGKAFDYQITMDPEYTYHGRFSVTSYEHSAFNINKGVLGVIVISIDANPYKLKAHRVYRLNAAGGRLFRLESGRRPVHPIMDCEQPTRIFYDGVEQIVPAGAHVINDVLFYDGYNDFYINSLDLWAIRWYDIDDSGEYPLTWGQAVQNKYRWDDIQKLGGEFQDAFQSWSEISELRWTEVATKRWADLNTKKENAPECAVYVKYDVEDL